MHSIVTIFRGAVIKVEVANFCAAMDTLIDQDGDPRVHEMFPKLVFILHHAAHEKSFGTLSVTQW